MEQSHSWEANSCSAS